MSSTPMDNDTHLMEEKSGDSGRTEVAPAERKNYYDDLPAEDIRLPQNWSMIKKIHASAVAWFFTFTLLISLTCYAAAVTPVMKVFGVGQQTAVLPFGLFLAGIFFAPLFTPHLSERVGRNAVYFGCSVGMAAFLLGSAYSQTMTQLAVTRFFAGFFGGPIVVNIEGTFADCWSAKHTVFYYTFIASAQYLGASLGPVICGPVIPHTDWRYSQFIPLMFTLAALLFGIGAPETYPRQIARSAARAAGHRAQLSPAPTGVAVGQMVKYTLIDPLIMLVTEPIIILSSILLAATFAITFSLFIVVPPVLMKTYSFDPYHLGIAFLTGVAGTALATLLSPPLDELIRPLYIRTRGAMYNNTALVVIEHRLAPAILGTLLMFASLFWIAYTATPAFHPATPVAGTGVFVAGSMMTVTSMVAYVFDLFPRPQSILSALTAMACARLAGAAIVPFFIVQDVLGVGGKWAFQIFAIIMVVLSLWPMALFVFGGRLRSWSRYRGMDEGEKGMSPMTGAAISGDAM